MATPSVALSGISIASDDPLFGDMLRIAAGVAGQSDCSWQPASARKRGAASAAAAAPADEEASKRARQGGAGAYRCLDTTHGPGCPR